MQKEQYCQCCKKDFILDESDIAFYAKLEVPHPTWCPECRMRRRLLFRNERTLYKRSCDLCKKSILAMFPADSAYTVYCESCWHGDKWDCFSYGRDYDFTRNFFVQFGELLKAVPRIALEVLSNENSPYTNYTWFCKNAYLSSSTLYSENVYYGKALDKCRDCVDCTETVECELCYELLTAEKCHNCSFLVNCRECISSSFLYDCQNCQDCFLSCNLRNKKYVVRNKQLTKEEYESEKAKLSTNNFEGLEIFKKEFVGLMREKAIHRHCRLINAVNSSGNNLTNTKDTKHCFDMYDLVNVRYATRGYNMKDSADLYGACDSELDYEDVNCGLGYRVRYSIDSYTGVRDLEYTNYCRQSSSLFACAGVRNGEYCIFNKSYGKEDFLNLKAKIIQQMRDVPYRDALGRVYSYGEFLPPEFSPFAYNEAIAGEYMPLKKDEAVALGFAWKEEDKRSVESSLKNEDIPININDVTEVILSETIECAHKGSCAEQCSYAFKLTLYELDFYKKQNLPLPRLCRNCRHYARLRLKNPWKLYKRNCMCDIATHGHSGVCTNEFKTTYAPERKEKVVCEDCYKNEIQ